MAPIKLLNISKTEFVLLDTCATQQLKKFGWLKSLNLGDYLLSWLMRPWCHYEQQDVWMKCTVCRQCSHQNINRCSENREHRYSHAIGLCWCLPLKLIPDILHQKRPTLILCLCVCVSQCVCVSVHVFVCLSVCLAMYLSVSHCDCLKLHIYEFVTVLTMLTN